MKYVLCGGGTGGHVMPAIAIGEGLTKYDRKAELLFIGRQGGPENISITDKGYALKTVEVYGLPRSISPKALKNLFKTAISPKRARQILQEFRPDAIIGTGGYVCWPVIKAGRELKIPCFLHESNSVAGRTTQRLAKHCQKIFTGFPVCEGIKDSKKVIFTGTPIRQEFKNISRSEARRRLKIPENKFLIFSFGGSGGAKRLNELMAEVMKEHKNQKIQYVHVSGEKYYERFKEKIENIPSAEIHPFIKNVSLYLAAADLVICRSGALTLSELAYLGRASILIPSPNVSNNHQYKNARLVSELGGALILNEEDTNVNTLIEKIEKIRNEIPYRKKIEAIANSLSPKNACDLICKEILKSVKISSATK